MSVCVWRRGSVRIQTCLKAVTHRWSHWQPVIVNLGTVLRTPSLVRAPCTCVCLRLPCARVAYTRVHVYVNERVCRYAFLCGTALSLSLSLSHSLSLSLSLTHSFPLSLSSPLPPPSLPPSSLSLSLSLSAAHRSRSFVIVTTACCCTGVHVLVYQ